MMKRLVFLFCLVGSLFADDRWTAYLFSNDYTTVRQGIKLGGDLNARWRGMTPLYNACRSGWTDIIELMIDRGADVDARSYGETPLLKVTGRKVNDVQLAKVLIGNGAKVNVQDSQGNTPLYHAIMNKNAKMINLLLDNGADMYIRNKKGDSAARFILSKKTMPSMSFENQDVMIGAQSFLLGRSIATINVVNKSKKFMKVTQVAMYCNGDLVGELSPNKVIPPSSKVSDIGKIPIPQKIYQTFKIKSNGRANIQYGLAIEYSLDGSSSSFEQSKEVELVLW